MSEIKFLGDLQRIEARPGDVFVLQMPHTTTHHVKAILRAQWEDLWRDDVRTTPMLLILDSGMKLGVAGTVDRPQRHPLLKVALLFLEGLAWGAAFGLAAKLFHFSIVIQ